MRKVKHLPWSVFYEPEWCEYKPEFTGLPVSIWVDVSGFKREENLHYIRFPWFEEGPFGNTNPMVICDDPYEPVDTDGKRTKDSIYQPVKAFVKKHQNLLKDVAYGKICHSVFEKKLKETIKSE